MAGPRNRDGVNDAADCYRTIGGDRYVAWMSFPSITRIAAYRAAGVRVRRFGEELFVREIDSMEAAQVDAKQDGPNA